MSSHYRAFALSVSPEHGYYERGGVGTRIEITAKLQRVSIKTLPVCVLIVAHRVIFVMAARARLVLCR